MHAEFVTTRDGRLLHAVREAITGADRVLMCVAFAAEGGVRLLERELKELQQRKRPVSLVATTVFGGAAPAALTLAQQLGVDVRTHNPSRGTFHAKVYLGIGARGAAKAFIGSANLTGGLASNVEAGMFLEGTLRDEPLKTAWQWAEESYGDPVVELWRPKSPSVVTAETLDEDLFLHLSREVARDPRFLTLGRAPKPNLVRELTPTMLLVETESSRVKGAGPQPIPAWMINVAWQYLKTHGVLTNAYLLNDLRVHRSSAVCALLARLPAITVDTSGGGITLRYVPPVRNLN